MSRVPVLRTERLILRGWREEDRAPFAAMNADPMVVAHLAGPLSREESDAFVDRILGQWRDHGWGLWAMELARSTEFIGYVGLWPAAFLDRDPPLEIGWRLASDNWGHGYVTEASRPVLRFAFTELGLPRVHSFTVPQNERSWRVMERIGMLRVPDGDFDHPRVDPEKHPHLVRHVLYAIERTDFEAQDSPSSPNAAS
ncbi:MAG TPA: GNAT family N-acetyltransferase [Candidatus Limnocylindria bacterium]